jgi:Protein of unknown function (DUF3455)
MEARACAQPSYVGERVAQERVVALETLGQGGATIGHHYAGPTWELTDGEVVKGKQSAAAPGATPGDAALLKLDIIEHRGSGILEDAKLVLRLTTRGGVLKGACPTAGELRAEPYSADYVFLR